MEGVIWEFCDTFKTSYFQSVCSIDKSRDSLVKFSDINIITHNPSKRNIDDELKAIREEKHKEYLHNAGHKSPSLENNKNNENSKQSDNFQDRNADKNQPKEANNKSLCLLGSCVIAGDFMVNGIDKKLLAKKHGKVKVVHFSGARIEDINQYIIPIIKTQPYYLILHVWTNNAATNTSK